MTKELKCDGGRKQLNGSGVQNHEEAELVAGDTAAAAGHAAGGLNAQRGCGIPKPQQVGREIGGESSQRFFVLAGLRQ